jgi:hypothetical protein
MSIPWSPPEVVVGDGVSDERSDVYSLAATLYTLLAGRSPFEVAGGQNRPIDLIGRIQQLPVPALDRPDAPGSLQRLLALAMAKDPSHRPASAAAFARELQAIEVEQRFSMTEFEVSDAGPTVDPGTPIDADAGATRVKQPTVIDAQGSGSTTNLRPQHTFSRTFVRPPAGMRNPPGANVVGSGGIIHQTPYVPTAPSPGGGGPVQPRVGGIHDTGDPAAGTYIAAQPATIALPGGGRRHTWIVVAVLAVALVAAVAVVGFVLLRDSGPIQVIEDVAVAPTGTDGRCRVTWAITDDHVPGDTVEITDESSQQPAGTDAESQEFEVNQPETPSEFFVQAVRDRAPVGEAVKARGRC